LTIDRDSQIEDVEADGLPTRETDHADRSLGFGRLASVHAAHFPNRARCEQRDQSDCD
jgi:hypothetical protein